MQILIGSAKIMTGKADRKLPFTTEPRFQEVADRLALELSGYSSEELQDMLKVNPKIAKENKLRFLNFHEKDARQPAVFIYDGMVFQKIAPESMDDKTLEYANGHLNIGSFLYGMLRPLDLINAYRLEGDVTLPSMNFGNVFDFWKPILTDYLIQKVKEDDGVLVNLASHEFKDILDWAKVTHQVRIITPEFKVDNGSKPKVIVIYAKMCRGAMTRWILENRINNIEDLNNFEYEGFRFISEIEPPKVKGKSKSKSKTASNTTSASMSSTEESNSTTEAMASSDSLSAGVGEKHLLFLQQV